MPADNPLQRQRRMPPPEITVIEDFFSYSTGVIVLAAAIGANGLANIAIQADSDFVWEKLTYFADAGAQLTEATKVVPLAQIMITDTGSGRQMFNVPMNLATIAGTGSLPYILSRPKLFDANSTIQISLTNRIATAVNIEVVLSGRKRFKLSGRG